MESALSAPELRPDLPLHPPPHLDPRPDLRPKMRPKLRAVASAASLLQPSAGRARAPEATRPSGGAPATPDETLREPRSEALLRSPDVPHSPGSVDDARRGQALRVAAALESALLVEAEEKREAQRRAWERPYEPPSGNFGRRGCFSTELQEFVALRPTRQETLQPFIPG